MNSKKSSKMFAQKIGRFGEDEAEKYLRKSHFEIIERNFRTHCGEIDIIARNSQYIIFAEVKTRNQNAISHPSAWVDLKKQKRIVMTACEYLEKNPTELQPRFDVIELIYLKDDSKQIRVNYIENAFNQEGNYASF